MALPAPPAADSEPPRGQRRIVEVVGARVRLEPAGLGGLRGVCPVCGSRAFHVRPTHDTFHCFGCGAGGSPAMFLMNCVTLWNTRYMNAALVALRAQGHPVLDADVARLSAFGYKHINVHGSYTFSAAELPGGLRVLRDPDAADEDDD